jgi:hypothetical protein
LKLRKTNPTDSAQRGERFLAQRAQVGAVQLNAAVGGPVEAAEQVQ